MEKNIYSFELLYELISSIFSQVPAVLEAFASLPLLVQQVVAMIVVILGVNILVAIIYGIKAFCNWWASNH